MIRKVVQPSAKRFMHPKETLPNLILNALVVYLYAKSKNRMRNLASFLPKFKKRGTLLGPNFFGTLF